MRVLKGAVTYFLYNDSHKYEASLIFLSPAAVRFTKVNNELWRNDSLLFHSMGFVGSSVSRYHCVYRAPAQ